MINLLALVLAIVLVSLLQPFFNTLVEKHLSLSTTTNSTTWIYGLLLLLAGSLFSGAYTAITLSGFNPVETLQGKISKTTKGILLRKSLVVAQLAISIMLIIATLIIYSHLHFMQR